MTILKIVKSPNDILHKKSKEVINVNDKTRLLMDNMIETMYKNNGVGLAAVQVGVLERILVIDVDYLKDDKKITKNNGIFMVNPQIIHKSKDSSSYNEGCLSFPKIQAEIKRPNKVKVKFLNYHGKEETMECEGLLSTCVQHEIDHLNGITFVDYLSRLKRNILLKKYRKNNL